MAEFRMCNTALGVEGSAHSQSQPSGCLAVRFYATSVAHRLTVVGAPRAMSSGDGRSGQHQGHVCGDTPLQMWRPLGTATVGDSDRWGQRPLGTEGWGRRESEGVRQADDVIGAQQILCDEDPVESKHGESQPSGHAPLARSHFIRTHICVRGCERGRGCSDVQRSGRCQLRVWNGAGRGRVQTYDSARWRTTSQSLALCVR